MHYIYLQLLVKNKIWSNQRVKYLFLLLFHLPVKIKNLGPTIRDGSLSRQNWKGISKKKRIKN